MGLTFSSKYFWSDFYLSPQGGALAHFDRLLSHDMVMQTDGSVPLGKDGSDFLAPAHFVALRRLFPFQQVQFV